MVVVPLSEQNPIERNAIPLATYGLILINGLVFLVELGLAPETDAGLVQQFALVPGTLPAQAVEQGLILTALTFVSYSFLHGGWVHIVGNMLFLWVFGGNVEGAMGHARFVVFYLLCALAGGVGYALSAPASMSPLVGASGAIAGIVCAYLMLRPCARIELALLAYPVRIAAGWPLGSWIVLQVVNALEHAGDGIAWSSHMGGLLAGGLLIAVMRRRDVRLFDCSGALRSGRLKEPRERLST